MLKSIIEVVMDCSDLKEPIFSYERLGHCNTLDIKVFSGSRRTNRLNLDSEE